MIKKMVFATTLLLLLVGCSSAIKSTNLPLTDKTTQQIELEKQQIELQKQQQEKIQPQIIPSKDEHDPIADDPFYAPIEPGQSASPISVTGSLFNSKTSHSLYSYIAPYAIGDSITVILKENASASKSASSTLESANDYALDPITIPGGELKINGKVVQLGLSKTSGFDGSSGADQKHSLSARITVSVVDILNNGNLKVRGEKWLMINNGKEYMRFTGIVRPLDVSEDNTVQSAQVANTRIEFSGTGDHAKVQKQGWLSSLLSNSL